MKKIIAVVNRRGGVGKTATTHAIGAGLRKKGYKVLLVDLDSQANLTFDVGIDAPGVTAYDLLTTNIKAEDAIVDDVIPASPQLSNADIVINGTGKEYRLKEKLEPMLNDYDYVVIDTPPALGILTINALTACTDVIIPAQAEVHSLQGIAYIHEAIEAVRKYTNPNVNILGILITRFNRRAIISQHMQENLEDIAQKINTRVFDTPIRENISMKEAQAMRVNIFDYAPKSNASKDYQKLIDEIESRGKE